MIGVIATLKIQPGKSAKFETFAAALAALIRENEPGNLTYRLMMGLLTLAALGTLLLAPGDPSGRKPSLMNKFDDN